MFKIIIIFTGFLIFCYINKDKALKDFDAKDFEEYFQSEQWNDCCDIANVEINIM